MPETMKLFGSTISKTAKDENSENVPHLEITEVILFSKSIAVLSTSIISKIQEFCTHLLLVNRLVNY